MADRTPTARQLEVLAAMDRLTRRQGPTLRQLADELGIASVHGAYTHHRLLEKKGLIELSADGRSWVLSDHGLRALKWKGRPAA